MATLASRTADIQASAEWIKLEGPTEIPSQAVGNFKVYKFTGLRIINDLNAAELVSRILYVYNEGQPDEEAEWKATDPVEKPFKDAAIIVLNNRIKNQANIHGVVPGSLNFNADLMTLIYDAIVWDGIAANPGSIVRYALTIDRTTQAKSHIELGTVTTSLT